MKPVDTRTRGTYRYQKTPQDKRLAQAYRNKSDPETAELQKTAWLVTSRSGFNAATQHVPSQRTTMRQDTEAVIHAYERDQRVLVYFLRQVEKAAGLGKLMQPLHCVDNVDFR